MNKNQNKYVDINAHDNYPDSEQKIEIPTMKVIPLKKICMSIGELPTSYLETMSYYEMLVWFINFLRDNIIPTVNGNGEAVEELQNVVMSLQNYINKYKDSIDSDVEELESYMNDYFENLDVQEEINNKLDEMLKDGVLEQIIEQFIQSTAIWCFDTVADMKQATNLINGSFAKTIGYYSANDGGSGLYKITNVQSQTDYQETLNNGLYATLIINDVVNVKQFGAYGDDSHDDTQAFLKAIAYINSLLSSNKVYILEVPTGVYQVTDTIHLSYYVRMRVKGFVEIYYNNTSGTCISIDDTPLKNIYFENGLYKSPIISGKNGGLRVFGNGRENDTIGIQLAGDTADASSTQKPRNGIEYVMIERFGIGLKFGTNNNYWTHFTEVVFTNNYKGLQIGSSTVTSINNTDENITFDRCIFGGNCYAIYELAPTIFKFFKTSFDMNEVLFYTNNAGKMIGFYECWIERNGLKKFTNFLPEADKGMFINTSQTTKQLIFNNSYFTYGGADEGAEVKNYLIRGNFTINGDNNHIEVGINFAGGGKHRLFLTDGNCYIHKNGMFSAVMPLSRKDSDNLNSEFNNTTNGSLPSSATATFGDYTVSRLYKFTGTIEDNDYYGENHMLHFTTPGGGYYEFISKKYSCKYGDIIRPLCIFKVKSNNLSLNSGLTCKMHFYDENNNLIEKTTPGAINKQEEVYFMPNHASYKVPQMATSYDIEINIYSNTGTATDPAEEFYIYGIYVYKL